MAQAILGDGVQIVGASYTGDNRASGIHSNADTLSPGVAPSDSGVILSTGQVNSFIGIDSNPNDSGSTTSGSSGPNNDAGFNAIAGTNTYDASYIDIDFTSDHDLLTLQFVFSSEEYPEYVNSIYNDIVGVWVNGSLVPLEIGNGNTSIGNLNENNNFNLYVDNTNDQYNTEMDGFTVTLSLTIPVNTTAVNSIRIGIADVGDNRYDSNLLIAGNSLQSGLIANSDSVTMGVNGTKTVDVLGNDFNSATGVITITHINGIAVSAGDSVLLATRQRIWLNADGTFTVETDGDVEAVNFTYMIENDNGTTDTGFVTIDTVPCFVAGTRIRTPDGERAVEALQPGDLVMTHDNGPQPVRWAGRRKVPARGAHAPVVIRAGAFGNHGELKVSPQHRVLLRDTLAELLFGESEVLVAAKDLVNDRAIRNVEGGEVEYVHILFDEHQVVYSEGLATESFLPGPQAVDSFEQDIVAEIASIFPELDPETGLGYGASARRTLKKFEAAVLMSRRWAA
ncbi:Hint domain-containing protein [Pseudoruegeria sp. SHC-113]|nr:Hint domain-containing protein [Pseudoruegeria sp. SHC-113]